MSSIDRLATDLYRIFDAANKKGTGPYETEAEVVRVEDEMIYVHIPGGVDETPVRKTIAARVGDKVQAHFEGGRGWLTGNITDPVTGDRTAFQALSKAKQANDIVQRIIKMVEDGDFDGGNGNEIIDITPEYCLASENYIPEGEEFENIQHTDWSEDIPEYEDGYFYWTRIRTTYADETVTYSDPIFASHIQLSVEADIAADTASGAATAAETIAQDALIVNDAARRVFNSQPTPPYSVGDIYNDTAHSKTYVCISARASGSYIANDWIEKTVDVSKYNHFWYDASGAHVSDTQGSVVSGTSMTMASNGIVMMRDGKLVSSWNQDPENANYTALNFYDGKGSADGTQDLVASYSRAGITQYINNKRMMALTPSGMTLYQSDGVTPIVTYGASGITNNPNIPFTIGNDSAQNPNYIKWEQENGVWKIKILADAIQMGGRAVLTDGDTGKWYTGTATYDSSTEKITGSGITDAKVGDMYLNTNTGDTYRCKLGGNANTATWDFSANIFGDDGYNSATIYLYQRSTSTPSVPSSTLTYTFSTDSLSGSIGSWSRSIPSGSNPIYVTSAFVSSDSSSVSISTGDWSTVRLMAENGGSGDPGYNSATIYLYQRATSTPSKPSSSLTYTFSSATLSGTLGNWSQTIPSGSNPIYVTTASVSSTSSSVTIATSKWSTVRLLSQNGTDVTSKYVSYITGSGVSVHEENDSSNYGLFNANGMKIYKGGKPIASFASNLVELCDEAVTMTVESTTGTEEIQRQLEIDCNLPIDASLSKSYKTGIGLRNATSDDWYKSYITTTGEYKYDKDEDIGLFEYAVDICAEIDEDHYSGGSYGCGRVQAWATENGGSIDLYAGYARGAFAGSYAQIEMLSNNGTNSSIHMGADSVVIEGFTNGIGLSGATQISGSTTISGGNLTVSNGLVNIANYYAAGGYKILTTGTCVFDNLSISSENNTSGNVSCARAGYTPIGVIGYDISNASSSGGYMSHCVMIAVKISGSTVYYQIRNNASKTAKIKCTFWVLYVANAQGV